MHLIIMGAPGSGKGTCCVDLKEILHVPHISTGDMFRKAIKEQTELGKIAKDLIDNGKFVPDDITNKLVEERIKEADCSNGFILDGYPRNLNQAIEFDKILKKNGLTLDAALNLVVDPNVVISRIVNRRGCPNCGASYNLISHKPKVDGICDVCGNALTKRADDNEETISTRLNVYKEQTEPLIEYYSNLNKLVNVDALGTPKEVLDRVIKALEA